MHGIQESLIDQDNNAVRVDIITGGSGGGGTVTVPNPIGVSGAVLGTVNDAAAEGDVSGSINAHLRAISKILDDTHDTINHEIRTSATSTPDQGIGNAGSSPWAVSGFVQGRVNTGQSLVGTNPLYMGINSGGGLGRFLTAVVSTRNTSGDAVVAVGLQVYDSGNNLFRDLLGDSSGRPFVNQGIGNAAGSPWAVSGTLTTSPTTSSTPVRTSVAGSASSGTILAANGNRRGATIYNDSTAALYLAFGGVGMSSSNFTVKIASSGYYEVPFSYTGVISGVWESATGSARVTEVT
jgi:hypothetical protein